MNLSHSNRCGLQDRFLYGILNGVDYGEWSPDTDPYTNGIYYSADDLSGKRLIKTKLRAEYQLPNTDDLPLIGMTTRFVEQKGIDLVTECAEQILMLNTQMIVLGSGEQRYQDFSWEKSAEKYLTTYNKILSEKR